MGRLSLLRDHVDYELEMIPDRKTRREAAVHLYGACLAAAILARRRGEDPELASMAALLHDLYAYRHGTCEDHARRGACLAREILEGLGLTSPEETDRICTAIRRHSSKGAADGPLDEVLKDADVLQHCMDDPSGPVRAGERLRYEALCRELGLQDGTDRKEGSPCPSTAISSSL